MDSPVRKQLKRNDYLRHKMFRKINRRKKAERKLAIEAPMKELKRRLRRYDGGKKPEDDIIYETQNTEDGTIYRVHPSAFGAKELNVTTPEVVVKTRDPRKYSSAFNGNQEYLDDLVGFVPIAGDINDAINAGVAVKNNNYSLAALLGAGLLLPNALENTLKPFRKIIYHGSRIPFDITKARTFSIKGGDTGFHVGDTMTPTFSRSNKLLGGTTYKGELILPEEPFELPDLNTWTAETLYGEAYYNPQFKLYLNNHGIDVENMINTADRIEKAARQSDPTAVDKYISDLFGERGINLKYKNKYETFHKNTDGYSYSIYTPEKINWVDLRTYDARKEDIQKLIDLGLLRDAGDGIINVKGGVGRLYDLLEQFPIYIPEHFKNGKSSGIYIKPLNRGKFTRLKKRTGKSASWFKAHGTPALKKMATFALNAKKWKH